MSQVCGSKEGDRVRRRATAGFVIAMGGDGVRTDCTSPRICEAAEVGNRQAGHSRRDHPSEEAPHRALPCHMGAEEGVKDGAKQSTREGETESMNAGSPSKQARTWSCAEGHGIGVDCAKGESDQGQRHGLRSDGRSSA